MESNATATTIFEPARNRPACLPENPSRLVTLWDIVNQFGVGRLALIVHCLSVPQAQLDAITKMGGGGEPTPDDQQKMILANVLSAQAFCKSSGLLDSAMKISLSVRQMQAGQMSIGSLATELRNIHESIFVESMKHQFIKVSAALSPLVDNYKPFGDEVWNSFPAARRDLTEAGNCLAVECGTACVFHLMRASEIALRALASDRGVSYPDASLSSKQVGDLLGALDGKLADMRKADSKLWPSKDLKDEQINFYHKAVAEFRDFNEAWRKYMAHAHEGAFYDCDMAMGIMKHVKTLMQVLAPKVSELSQTPIHWTQP